MRGILTDGFDSTLKSLRTLFPGARLGNCLRHALTKLPTTLTAIEAPVRKALRSRFHTLLSRARQRKGLRVFALGQRLRRFAQFIGVCRRSKWSKHLTLSPLLALLAMVGSNATCKMSSACSQAFR